MDNLRIRKYEDDDFIEIVDLLSRNLEFDNITSSLIREKIYEDPSRNPRTLLVAEYKGAIAGFIQGVIREVHKQKIGYIKLMAVDGPYRRKGIATALYQVMEEYFRSKDLDAVRIFDVPLNYLQPGVDTRYHEALSFAERVGFEDNGEAVNMQVDLGYSEWETEEKLSSLRAEKLDIRRAEKEDIDELKKFVTKYWELWEFEVEMAMKNDPPTMFIAVRGKEVMAFSAYDGNNIGTGWFGPMGTDPDLQGKGVGSVLLYLCLADMKGKGFKESTIPWVGPTGFYEHHAGARISRTFRRFEKRLEEQGKN